MLKNTLSSVEKGRIFFEARKYEAVLSELAFYLENHQEDSDARFLLAESLWRVGRNAEALRQFEKCFDGDISKRDITVHVCCLLYHEISIAKFYWSDLIYWCSSAIYCGVSEVFVEGLLAKFCCTQVHGIDYELLKSHSKWISDIKTLTEDVKKLRLSLKRINKTSKKTKSNNIHGVNSDPNENLVNIPYHQENSQIYRYYSSGFDNFNLNYVCSTYFNTNILPTYIYNTNTLPTYSNNNNFNINNRCHKVYNSIEHNIHDNSQCTKVTPLQTRTRVKLLRSSEIVSKPIKNQRQRNRKVYIRKLRKDLLLMILKYLRNTNLILSKCISYTHTRVLNYMSYILGIKYMNYLPNTTRAIGCVIDENSNSEINTNIYNLNTSESCEIPFSSRGNVQNAINNFCTDNKVILERLWKKSKFDTKVATFNAIAKFCNSNDILKCLKSRSYSNECNLSSPSEVPNTNKEYTPNFVQIISDDSYAAKITSVSLETYKCPPKILECSSDAQQVSKSQINITSNEHVPSPIKEADKHELNILVYKYHCDHEIITKAFNDIYTNDYITENVCNFIDGNASNDIQHNVNNNIEKIKMISCRDLEYKQTCTQVNNNKTHVNCVKQKNFEVTEVTKKYYIAKNTCFYNANDGVLGTSINFAHNNLNSNNCFVNICKRDQTAVANTLNNTQYNDSSNIIQNSFGENNRSFMNKTNNDSLSESYFNSNGCATYEKVAETILPYNDRPSTINFKEYSETQRSTIWSEVDKTLTNNSSNFTPNFHACFKIQNNMVTDKIVTKYPNFANYPDTQSNTLSDALVNLNSSNFPTQYFTVEVEGENNILAADDGTNSSDSVQKFETQNNPVCKEDMILPIDSCPRTPNSIESQQSTDNNLIHDTMLSLSSNFNISANYLDTRNIEVSNGVICLNTNDFEDSILALNYHSKMTDSKDFFEVEKYKACDEVNYYRSKSNNSPKNCEEHSGIGYISSQLDNFYANNVSTTFYKLADDGYVETQISDKYTDEVDYPNISNVKVCLERQHYAVCKEVKDYALLSRKILKMQQVTICDEVDNTILSYNSCSNNINHYGERTTNMDCVAVDKSVQCLTTPNLNNCREAQNSTVCIDKFTILACDGPPNTYNSADIFKTFIMRVFEACDKHVLELNLEVLNKIKEAGLAANICLNTFKSEKILINLESLGHIIEANVQYDGQLGRNLCLLRKYKSQNVGFIPELDDTHNKHSEKLDDIQPVIEDFITFYKNIKNEYDSLNFKTDDFLPSNDYYPFKNEQRFGKTILNTVNTQRNILRLLENVDQRFFKSMYNVEKFNYNMFHVIRSCHSELLLKCYPPTSEHSSGSSCSHFSQDCSKSCVKSYSINDGIFHTTFNSIKMSEICRSIASLDGGYNSEVSVDNKTIHNTQNFSFSMQNTDEKYYSWSTNRKHFNSKAWSTYLNSIVKKYLYKTYIPHYVNPKVELSIYLSNINIDQSTTGVNSFNSVLKIYDLLNSKSLCRDRCKCQIDHLIYNSFLHATLPNMRAISNFCDPSKLLVHNLCGDVFAKPVFNGVLRGNFMPKSISKVKDSKFLLVNLCTLKKP